MEPICQSFSNHFLSEQNDEGLYQLIIKDGDRKKTYKTGFFFSSIKRLSDDFIRLCQTDPDGNKKFGLITLSVNYKYIPCTFDKIKPYSTLYVQALINEEDYYIDRFGNVYNKEFMKIRNYL